MLPNHMASARFRITVFTLLVAVASPACGDILLFNGFRSLRLGEDGSIKREYQLANWPQLYEDLESHIFDSSKGILYQLTNTLGFVDEIPFDVETGAFLGGRYINSNGQMDVQPYSGGALDFHFRGPPSAQVFGSRFGQFDATGNELFVVRATQPAAQTSSSG